MSDTTKTDSTTPPISQTDDISVAVKTEPAAVTPSSNDEAPKEAVSEKTDIPVNPTQDTTEAEAPIVPEASNQPADSSDELVSAPAAADKTMSVPAASMPPISAEAAAPVVVSPEEVKDDASEHQKLAEEIEILTGEIQALEAKIERLAGSVSTPPPTETKPEPTTAPSNDLSPADSSELPPADLPPAAPSFDPSSTLPTLPDAPAPKPNFDAASTINDVGAAGDKPRERSLEDIYPKKDEPIKMPDAPAKTATPASDDQPSVLGLIGEVVGIIGIVLFVLMLLSPLYKEMLGVVLWDSLRTLGWLSAVGALLVGFLLSLFTRGKWALKIVLLVFLILAAALYYSINTPGSLLEPLLGSLLSFYQ